jgi:hypothetical protein
MFENCRRGEGTHEQAKRVLFATPPPVIAADDRSPMPEGRRFHCDHEAPGRLSDRSVADCSVR